MISGVVALRLEKKCKSNYHNKDNSLTKTKFACCYIIKYVANLKRIYNICALNPKTFKSNFEAPK